MLALLRFQNKTKGNRGYVALLSVLIASAAGVAVSISLLVSGTNAEERGRYLEDGERALSSVLSCVEVALQKIRLDAAYAGGETLSWTDTECEIFTIDQVDTVYTFGTEGRSGDAVKKFYVQTQRIEDPDTFVVTMNLVELNQVADL